MVVMGRQEVADQGYIGKWGVHWLRELGEGASVEGDSKVLGFIHQS